MADCLKLFKDKDVATSEGSKFHTLIVLGKKEWLPGGGLRYEMDGDARRLA